MTVDIGNAHVFMIIITRLSQWWVAVASSIFYRCEQKALIMIFARDSRSYRFHLYAHLKQSQCFILGYETIIVSLYYGLSSAESPSQNELSFGTEIFLAKMTNK